MRFGARKSEEQPLRVLHNYLRSLFRVFLAGNRLLSTAQSRIHVVQSDGMGAPKLAIPREVGGVPNDLRETPPSEENKVGGGLAGRVMLMGSVVLADSTVLPMTLETPGLEACMNGRWDTLATGEVSTCTPIGVASKDRRVRYGETAEDTTDLT